MYKQQQKEKKQRQESKEEEEVMLKRKEEETEKERMFVEPEMTQSRPTLENERITRSKGEAPTNLELPTKGKWRKRHI